MNKTIPATEFKARCLDLMDEVARRRVRYVVTKRGVPVAELIPIDAPEISPIGFLHGTVVQHGDIVAPDHETWHEAADPLLDP